MVGLCVVGGKTVSEKKVDLVSSSGVMNVAALEDSVGCTGAAVTAEWVVMELVEVDASVVGLGERVLGVAAVLPGTVFICSFSFRIDVFIMVAAVFLASGISLGAVSSEGGVGLIVVSVVSLAVMLGRVLAGSSIKGFGDSVILAVTLWVVGAVVSVILVFRVAVDGADVALLLLEVTIFAERCDVLSKVPRESDVSDLDSFAFVDWLLVVFGRNDLGPALVLGPGTLCWRRFSSMKMLIGPSPLNP